MSTSLIFDDDVIPSPGRPLPMVLQATHDSIAVFERGGTTIVMKRDDALFREGDPAECYFKVLSGAVRGCNLLADGRRHIGDFFLPGDFIGLDAAKFYGFTAEVVSSTVIVRYARWKIDTLAGQELEIAQSLVTVMRDGLAAARDRMMLLGHMTAIERIANFLLMMADKTGTSRITLPMTRGDIGDHLGLTIETVSRAFGQLKKDRIIEQKTIHSIMIADRNALVDLADVC
jgi:CRP-like cAMP-binding protein